MLLWAYCLVGFVPRVEPVGTPFDMFGCFAEPFSFYHFVQYLLWERYLCFTFEHCWSHMDTEPLEGDFNPLCAIWPPVIQWLVPPGNQLITLFGFGAQYFICFSCSASQFLHKSVFYHWILRKTPYLFELDFIDGLINLLFSFFHLITCYHWYIFLLSNFWICLYSLRFSTALYLYNKIKNMRLCWVNRFQTYQVLK